MATTTEKQTQDEAEFAAQFEADEPKAVEQTEDEAFGLAEPEPTDAGDGAGDVPADAGEGEGEGLTTDTGDAAGGTEPAPSEAETRLKEWEERLAAKEAELAAKESAAATSSVERTETSTADAVEADAGDGADDEGDPGKALAEDFGADFVQLLTRYIKQICKTEVGDGIGGVKDLVDEVVATLTAERQASHFNAINSAHADFLEIVDSPEFGDWKAGQEQDEQVRLQRVIDSGSAQEIIDMLTAFKNAKSSSSVNEDELDGAEGVRSTGLTLPKQPAAADDYAAAWNEQ